MEFSAAIARRAGDPLSIERVKIGSLGPSDVLVRIHAAGLCHTDREVMTGSVATVFPCILGHEGAGVVEAVGSAVTRVKKGDHVVCSIYGGACGHCFYCRKSQRMFCEEISASKSLGTIPKGMPRFTQGEQPLHHFLCTSCYAEYTVLPEGGAVAIPREVPFEQACILGCCVTTGFGAATRVTNVPIGASVAVIGCGPIGINVLQGASVAGAADIIAIDTNPDRLVLAQQFGATCVLSPKTQDVIAEIRKITHGRGVDYAFEAGGNDQTIQLSLEVTRPGGHVTILGKTPPDHHIPIRFGAIMGGKTILRSTLGGAHEHEDFPRLCRLYLDGRLKLDELITRRIGLADINDGMKDLDNAFGLRTVIRMH